ncbi:hypothetical protein [Clostridium sp.]
MPLKVDLSTIISEQGRKLMYFLNKSISGHAIYNFIEDSIKLLASINPQIVVDKE